MCSFSTKIKISYLYILRVLGELFIDLYFYYTSCFPLLLIVGAFKRIKRRLKLLWLPKGPGRPAVPENIVDLIMDMKRSNLLWGALRISQELALMGISLHKRTISEILNENGFTTPPMKYQPPTWESLLVAARETWAMDFCNIIDLKLFQIYILGIINIKTREVVWHAITLFPNRDWIIQQFRNLAIDDIAFPNYLIIDNDGIYGRWVDSIFIEYFEIEVLRIRKGCPWENGKMERYWRSLQEELIFRLPIQNESSLRYFCRNYSAYFNSHRPHQGILGQTPVGKAEKQTQVVDLNTFKYKKVKHLHGLFTEFKVAA